MTRQPHPDPKTEAWIQKQLAAAPPLSPQQRREIAADIQSWRRRETERRVAAAMAEENDG